MLEYPNLKKEKSFFKKKNQSQNNNCTFIKFVKLLHDEFPLSTLLKIKIKINTSMYHIKIMKNLTIEWNLYN